MSEGKVRMTAHDVSNLRMLVIDDDEFVLNMAVRILKKIGCGDVTTVGNARHAIDIIASPDSNFDIVITDLNMPEIDGVELLRHIAEYNYPGGIILLSGEDERILETALDLARSHNLNVLGAIQKPLRPGPLMELLQSFELAQAGEKFMPQEPITVDELRQGIDGNELQLFYQPKVNILIGEITGVEALARWKHPDRGIIGPGAFIPVAEKNGLIDALTFAVYKKAVYQAGAWQADGIDLQISINISANSFLLHDFSDFLIGELQRERVDPARIILEVTESQVMSDAKGCLEKMMHLRMKKFGLSIDDFGTGNSSMEKLKRIPFTELKIDRAFVHGAAQNSSALAILESSISLGKKLKMSVVAEGVETREDWDLMEQLGCDSVQGFYIAKPMPEPELRQFIKTWSGPHGQI